MADLQQQIADRAIEAQKLARKYFVVELDFTVESLKPLDAACDDVDFAMPGGKSEENLAKLSRLWGAYVGEVLRQAHGGAWIGDSPDDAVLRIDGRTIEPAKQVRARLAEGPDHRLSQLADHLDS